RRASEASGLIFRHTSPECTGCKVGDMQACRLLGDSVAPLQCCRFSPSTWRASGQVLPIRSICPQETFADGLTEWRAVPQCGGPSAPSIQVVFNHTLNRRK